MRNPRLILPDRNPSPRVRAPSARVGRARLRATSGTLVMMPSTPVSASQRMRSGSSPVQVLTATPAAWAGTDQLGGHEGVVRVQGAWPPSATAASWPRSGHHRPWPTVRPRGRCPARSPATRWRAREPPLAPGRPSGRWKHDTRKRGTLGSGTGQQHVDHAVDDGQRLVEVAVVGPVLDLDVDRAEPGAGVERGARSGTWSGSRPTSWPRWPARRAGPRRGARPGRRRPCGARRARRRRRPSDGGAERRRACSRARHAGLLGARSPVSRKLPVSTRKKILAKAWPTGIFAPSQPHAFGY